MSPTSRNVPSGPTIPITRIPPGEVDTVLQSYQLGFSGEESKRLRSYFVREGRDPTRVEISGIAQSWSEHCSYKTSKPFLKRYVIDLPDNARALARGDAGVMPIDSEWAYALRIESHNHPSAIEPYGGAATGIGGILRDVLAMGAKPVALADPLFFGPLHRESTSLPTGVKHPDYLFRYVVSGIADYGNRVGVPTVSGSLTFDEAYTYNPLVNVGCVGVLRRKNLLPNRARHVGEKLVLVGGLTGRDGIGGVSFASKELTGKSEKESRPAVQLGNPIMKEPLIHAVLESVEQGLISGLKDLGGGGLATSSGELVYAGGFGSEIHLDRVPLRESGLEPWEIWISESQERMLLSVGPAHLRRLETIFRLHGVPFSVIGEVTPPPYESLYYEGRLVGRLEVGFRVEPALLDRPVRSRRRSKMSGALLGTKGSWEEVLSALLGTSQGASREPVVRLYDHEVQGNTEVGPLSGHARTPTHSDAAVLRIHPDLKKGLAIATGSAPFIGALDPETGGKAAVVEAAQNLFASGARPDALTDCLNFGNPEDPEVLGDFDASLEGLASAARALGLAIPSGNVSFYNGGFGYEIPPTPVVLAVGIHPDVERVVTTPFKRPGNVIYLLGETSPHMGGSLYARTFSLPETSVPDIDPAATRRLGEVLLDLGERRWVESCHDVSEGGIGVALCEMAFGRSLGFDVTLPELEAIPPWRGLVSEGGSRWLFEVSPSRCSTVEEVLGDLPWARLGQVTPSAGVIRSEQRVEARLDLIRLYREWRDRLATTPGA